MKQDYKTLDGGLEQDNLNIQDQKVYKSFAFMENEYSQNHVIQLYFYKTNYQKQLLFLLYSVMTVGVFYLVSRWSIDIFIRYNLDICEIDEARYIFIIDPKFSNSLEKLSISTNQQITFEYQYMQFYYQQGPNQFYIYKQQFNKLKNEQIHDLINQKQSDRNQIVKFGNNQLEVSLKGPLAIIVDEILNPFNIFQMFSFVIWYLHEYETYAKLILVITVITIIYNLCDIMSNLKYLKQMLQQKGWVERLIDGKHNSWQKCDVVNLLPGDIIKIGNTTTIPADCVLLKGKLIVNESMLTGESVPLTKYSLPNNQLQFQTRNENMLYYGCEIINPNVNASNIALVYETGFRTQKGQLARTILFVCEKKFTFFKDSLQFIKFNFILTILGYLLSLPSLLYYENSLKNIILCGLDLFTISIPPQLPIAMLVGIDYSIKRLKQKGILAIHQQKINTAGEINVVAFDKTGTLTENKLNVKGVVINSIQNQQQCRLEGFIGNYQYLDRSSQIIMNYCHNILDVQNELQGDELEIAIMRFIFNTQDEKQLQLMFQQSQSQADFKILKVIQFDAKNQYMAVLIQQQGQKSLLIKGSPEKLISVCKKQYQPNNFESVCDYYCNKGYRLLGFGYKSIGYNWNIDDEIIIDGIELQGLLVFENKLKQKTTQSIYDLKKADIDVCMITGDHLLTAVQVAKECGIVDVDQQVVHVDHNQNQIILNNQIMDGYLELKQTINQGQKQLAVTGSLILQLQKEQNIELLHQLVEQTRVFARTSPQQKQDIIELLQNNNKDDRFVCMVGDGANDCQALKVADVGLSLTENEASLACDFCSKTIKDISCVNELIIEGKACLTTSISSFKFMSLYSIIQFIGVCILYYFNNDFDENMYYYQDIWILSILVYTMNGTLPASKLTPHKPNSKLVSFEIIFDLISQHLINLGFQMVGLKLLFEQSWFVYTQSLHVDEKQTSNYKTNIFLIQGIQLIFCSITAHKGIPLRKAFFTNLVFMFSLTVTIVVHGMLMFWTSNSDLQEQFNLYQFESYDYRYKLLYLILVNIGFLFLFNLLISPVVARIYNSIKPEHKPKNQHLDLEYQGFNTYEKQNTSI